MDVGKTQIQVEWEFDTNSRSKRSTQDNGYTVGVRVQYKKESDKDFLIYPPDGSKLPAEKVDFV